MGSRGTFSSQHGGLAQGGGPGYNDLENRGGFGQGRDGGFGQGGGGYGSQGYNQFGGGGLSYGQGQGGYVQAVGGGGYNVAGGIQGQDYCQGSHVGPIRG